MSETECVKQQYQDRIQALEDRNQVLKDRNRALEDELASEKANAERWKELYFSFRQQRFGKSAECAQQLGANLFDEAELENLTDAVSHSDGEVTEQQVHTYTRRASRNRVLTAAADTPVVDIRHDGDAPICACGAAMRECGEFVRDTLSIVPATRVVVRHHYPQYACCACLGEPGEQRTVTVSPDASVLGGTVCDPALLATIVTDKMQFGLPLYRQEQKLLAPEGALSRQAMSNWMMLAGTALEPLSRALERSLRLYPLWHVDETGLRVLNVPGDTGSDAARNCFMIVRAAVDRDGSRGPVLFTFSERRTNERISAVLQGYRHVVQSDGLSGYAHAHREGSFTHLGCMVHARRKAADILKTNRKARLAGELVKLYGTFFHHESELLAERRGPHPLADDQYLAKRKKVLQPDLDAIREWLERHRPTVLKGSALERAIIYPLQRWDQLTRFLEYPYATSSNQLAENSIRPFALDRKNFLFCITPQGAQVSALYFSLVESCKALDIDPHAYLTYLFAHAGACKTDEDWDALIPGRADLSGMDAYYALLRSAKPDPDRKKPYILRGKKF